MDLSEMTSYIARMDNIDTQLIAALRRNGRASVSDLAIALGVSRNTVRARMARLENSGEVIGYSVVLKNDGGALAVRGVMLISIEGKGTDKVIARLNGIAAATAIHTTNGRWDLVIELATGTLEGLDMVLRQIRLIDGIAASETNLYLSTRRSAGIASRPSVRNGD